MRSIPFDAAHMAISLCSAARAGQDYVKAMPDLARIKCSFRPVQDARVAGFAAEIRSFKSEARAHVWPQDDFPPWPILAILSHPLLPDTAMTTVVSVDVIGEIGMISRQPWGEAVLSKPHKPADQVTRWTAQKGEQP